MLKIAELKIRSFDINYLDIYWEVEDSREDPLSYAFVLERSDSEFGPFSVVTPELVNKYHVRDNTIRGKHSFYYKTYYRIRVINRNTRETYTYPETGAGVKLAAPPDLAALEMARLNNLRIKEFAGRKIWVFPKRRAGQRCEVCFDPVTSRKLKSACAACYDTTWSGGYYAPVETYGTIITPNETTLHAPFGEVETQDSSILLGNYPEVFDGDIIVEAENIRWRVGAQISKVTKGRCLIRQQAPIHRIPNGDIEYSLPMNLSSDELRDMQASPERNFSNPQTLASTGLIKALNGLFVRPQ